MADLKQVSRNGKMGYETPDGTIVIEPKYDDCIGAFGLDSYNHTEYAIVAINDKCGMINESGEIVISLEYQEVKYLFDDLFAARKESQNKSWCVGVVKPNGDIIVPFEYKYIVVNGKYIVCYKEAESSRVYTHTLIDTHGSVYKYVCESGPVVYNFKGRLIFEGEAVSSDYDLLITTVADKYGIIDNDGKIILNNQYDEISIVGPDRFVVRVNNEESWSFGVLNKNLETIIAFSYKYIESNDGWFYKCYKECESNKANYRYDKKPYEYSNQSEEYWLNSKGKIIYNGEAEVLSPTLIVCDRKRKKAVFDDNGKRIVNFLYDRIRLLDNYLVVEKNSKVGVLTDSGQIVIDALYESIEFVHIDDSVTPKYTYCGNPDGEVYGAYNSTNVFDTASDKNRLNRQMIYISKPSGFRWYSGISCPREHYSFNDVMILRTTEFAELFSLDEGVIDNSKYDTIQQLTDLSYVVSIRGKFGVFRRDIQDLVIPCEYDRIVFEGGHVVLLNKDGLWGAKTLVLPSHPFYSMSYADVPISFKEISILNGMESLYGVKRERNDYIDGIVEEYTIVDERGEEFKRMGSFYLLSSMPIMYDYNHILTSHDNKFGFVSVNGYISVPFIFDEIKERKDSFFDVRINNDWGVIDVSGKIVVTLKYNSPIPSIIKDAVVCETISGRLGVLGIDGREIVPTVYEHLMPEENLIYCGFGGCKCCDSDYGNFFSGNIKYAIWGVLTKDGVPVIDVAYDCFKESDGFILAGRNGGFLGKGQHGSSYYEGEYSGVYDLYDYEGNLLIGGFNKFLLDEQHDLMLFHFGGGWKQRCEDYDKWGNAIYYYDYYFEEGIGRWLILDREFSSIIPKADGSRITFEKGMICTITKKKEANKITYYWNFPLEVFSVSEPIFECGYILVGNSMGQRLIRFSDKLCSQAFSKIMLIDEDVFFTYKNDVGNTGIGISSMEKELISCKDNYSLLTIPVADYVFAAQKIDDDYIILMINMKEPNHVITAISRIKFRAMADMLQKGKLQLLAEAETRKTKRIIVRDKSIFDESFLSAIEVEERDEQYNDEITYWYSVDFTIGVGSDNEPYVNGGNGCDYEQETWDAMTDGMYGDMPEGFDGDYGFMGE